MTKYKIILHGKKFRIHYREKGLARSRVLWKETGFYATRFVEAPDNEGAVASALELLTGELSERKMYADSSSIEVVKVIEDASGYDRYAPGGGFTFYSDDDDDGE